MLGAPLADTLSGSFLEGFSDTTLLNGQQTLGLPAGGAHPALPASVLKNLDYLAKKEELSYSIKEMADAIYGLKKNLHYIDSRIGLLVTFQKDSFEKLLLKKTKTQNKIQKAKTSNLEEANTQNETMDVPDARKLDQHHVRLYGSLMALLQIEPSYLARLITQVSSSELEKICSIIALNLYSESDRDEHLLLSLIQMLLIKYEDSFATPSLQPQRESLSITSLLRSFFERESPLSYLHGLTKELKENLDISHDEDAQKNPLLKKLYVSSSIYSYDSTSESIEIDQSILDLMQKFLDLLFDSVQTAPYSIRWICKQLYNLIQRKFMLKSEQPSFAESFYCFFLEIVWPVIYNMYPKGANNKIWMDMDHTIRALRHQSGHSSASLELFLNNNECRFLAFLKDFVNVPDFHVKLQTEQYLFLACDDTICMQLEEVYFLHKILFKYRKFAIDDLAELSTVDRILDELGDYPRHNVREPISVKLPLFNRWTLGALDDNPSFLVADFLPMSTCLEMDVRAGITELVLTLNQSPIQDIQPFQTVYNAAESEIDILNLKGRRMRKSMMEFQKLTDVIAVGVLIHEIYDDVHAQSKGFGHSLKGQVQLLKATYQSLSEEFSFLASQVEAYRVYHLGCRAHLFVDKGANLTWDFSKMLRDGLLIRERASATSNKDSQLGLVLTASMPEPSLLKLTLRDKNQTSMSHHHHTHHSTSLSFQFWIDDLLEKLMYGITTLRLESIQISIPALLDAVF